MNIIERIICYALAFISAFCVLFGSPQSTIFPAMLLFYFVADLILIELRKR